MNIIAYHGWACCREDWMDWKTALPAGTSFERWDRGYFGKGVEVSQTEIDIVITHSMGLLQVPEEILGQTKHLIALHPFAYFPSYDAKLADRVVEQIDRMVRNMGKRPLEQIQTFRRQAGLAALDVDPADLNTSLITEDLQRLKTEMINIDLIRAIPKVVWVHEEQDSIIQSRCQIELQHEFPLHVHLFEGKGSHSFSFKHPETIISRLLLDE